MTRRHALLAAAATVALGGCAQLPFFARGDTQGHPQSFEMQGRVYVRFGPKAFSGTLRWQHALERDEVWLGGPLGQTGAHIVRDSGGATLTTANQLVYRATSIESLTREGLGWSLPLADLSYYVLGALPPGAHWSGASGDAAARDGWTARMSRREGVAADAPPSRLDLSRDDVEIRLVVDRLDRTNRDGDAGILP